MSSAIARRRFHPFLSTVVSLCLFSASTEILASSSAAPTDSGIKGRVTLGPVRPSTRIGETTKDVPFRTTLDIVSAEDDSLVRQIRTRPNGTFVVGLPPGNYIVRSAPSDTAREPSIEPVSVTVPPHEYVEVTLDADSGIR